MKNLKWAVAFLGVTVSAAALAGDLGIKPGLWEVHIKSVMRGMPFSPPPQTHRHCVTKKQARNAWRDMQGNKNCRFSDIKIKGNRAEWHMQCTGEAAMQGAGFTVVEDPKRYHGVSNMVSHSGGETYKIRIETTGRWVGVCR